MRVLVLSGSGRTADPWHPFAATSADLARIAEDAGFAARIVHGPLEGLAALAPDGGTPGERTADAARPSAREPADREPDASRGPALDLAELAAIVVNAGDHLTPLPEGVADPGPPSPQLLAAASAGLRAALDAGVGLLGVHAAASTLRELPGFGEALGVRWERDVSWHPPFGRLRVEPGEAMSADAPPLLLEAPFEVADERYTSLRIADDATVIARCADEEGVHPLVLARRHGAARVVYSALGHDERSFTSAAHRALLAGALRWIARR